MDDQWMLAHLVLSPEFDVRAIITSHAPNLAAPASETSARTVNDVLANLPIKKRPDVIAGSPVPMMKAQPTNAGVERILKESKGFSRDRRLVVLVIGPGTDTALALQKDPTLDQRIEIVAMGFLNWPKGGNEWNINNDIPAWQVLLRSRAPIAVGDHVVCKKDLLMDRERANTLFGKSGPAGQYLITLLTDFIDKNPGVVEGNTGKKGVWPVWDSVTLGYLMGISKYEDKPRPMLDDKANFEHSEALSEGRTIRWITSVDSPKLWSDFVAKLAAAQAKQPTKP
jgi:inosine-uridine nucleoside N-ribohydrolase